MGAKNVKQICCTQNVQQTQDIAFNVATVLLNTQKTRKVKTVIFTQERFNEESAKFQKQASYLAASRVALLERLDILKSTPGNDAFVLGEIADTEIIVFAINELLAEFVTFASYASEGRNVELDETQRLILATCSRMDSSIRLLLKAIEVATQNNADNMKFIQVLLDGLGPDAS